ncbi:MAG: hypothetical protein S4CHLAM102_01900 [Chlamydiia bacterium]|nr:hypothetical protein [Chlamydiia bacterium]
MAIPIEYSSNNYIHPQTLLEQAKGEFNKGVVFHVVVQVAAVAIAVAVLTVTAIEAIMVFPFAFCAVVLLTPLYMQEMIVPLRADMDEAKEKVTIISQRLQVWNRLEANNFDGVWNVLGDGTHVALLDLTDPNGIAQRNALVTMQIADEKIRELETEVADFDQTYAQRANVFNQALGNYSLDLTDETINIDSFVDVYNEREDKRLELYMKKAEWAVATELYKDPEGHKADAANPPSYFITAPLPDQAEDLITFQPTQFVNMRQRSVTDLNANRGFQV